MGQVGPQLATNLPQTESMSVLVRVREQIGCSMHIVDRRMLAKESPLLTAIILAMGRQGRQLSRPSLGRGQQCFHITDLLDKAGTLSRCTIHARRPWVHVRE